MHTGVSDPAGIPKLREDFATSRMYRRRYLLPGGNLPFAAEAGSQRTAKGVCRDIDCLTDDQSGTGTLGIIGSRERPRHAGSIGRHRSHHHVVAQIQDHAGEAG